MIDYINAMPFLTDHGLTIFDAIVLVILIISAITAFFRGFCKELFTLLALIGAIFISGYLSYLLLPSMESIIPHPLMANAAAKILTFLLASLVLGLTGKLLAHMLRQTISVPLDAGLGIGFGILRGAMLIFIPFFFLTLYLKPDALPDWLAKSKTLPYLEEGAKFAKEFLPENYFDHKMLNKEDIQEAVSDKKEKIKETKSDITHYTAEERARLDKLIEKTK